MLREELRDAWLAVDEARLGERADAVLHHHRRRLVVVACRGRSHRVRNSAVVRVACQTPALKLFDAKWF